MMIVVVFCKKFKSSQSLGKHETPVLVTVPVSEPLQQSGTIKDSINAVRISLILFTFMA